MCLSLSLPLTTLPHLPSPHLALKNNMLEWNPHDLRDREGTHGLVHLRGVEMEHFPWLHPACPPCPLLAVGTGDPVVPQHIEVCSAVVSERK